MHLVLSSASEIQVLLSHEHARLVVVPLLLDMTSVSRATSTAAVTSAVAACW